MHAIGRGWSFLSLDVTIAASYFEAGSGAAMPPSLGIHSGDDCRRSQGQDLLVYSVE